ncbi:hypothetical protein G4B88_030982 [Cannabis sativa]|nr:hypothetical protein G4B88_030982 [Cannabis sativa]
MEGDEEFIRASFNMEDKFERDVNGGIRFRNFKLQTPSGSFSDLLSYWVASVECSKYCGSWGYHPRVDTAVVGLVSINVDVGHRMEDKSATTGIVIWGNDGVVQCAAATVLPMTTSPLIAELYAIRDGIRTGLQCRLPRF